jgi:hypothetical protein
MTNDNPCATPSYFLSSLTWEREGFLVPSKSEYRHLGEGEGLLNALTYPIENRSIIDQLSAPLPLPTETA